MFLRRLLSSLKLFRRAKNRHLSSDEGGQILRRVQELLDATKPTTAKVESTGDKDRG
jgi:hypothetical protein